MKEFLLNNIFAIICALAVFLFYSTTRAKNWSANLWLIQNRFRIYYAFGAILCLNFIVTFIPNAEFVLAFIGLPVNGASSALIGTVIGAYLVAFKRSEKY